MKRSIVAHVAVSLLAGCSSPPVSQTAQKDLEKSRNDYQELVDQFRRSSDNSSGFYIDDSPAIAVTPLTDDAQKAKAKEWLTRTMITVDPARNSSISAAELIRMFRQQYGINIVTTLPLDGYSYNGFGVTHVDAETALSIFLGAMGLDFDLDNDRKVVTVQPMQPRTWTLNLGNRRTNYSSGRPAAAGAAGGTGVATGSAGSTTGFPSLTSGTTGTTTSAVGGAVPATGTAGTSSDESSVTGIAAADDFWGSLNREIKERLTILVPRADQPAAAGLSPVMPGAPMPAPMPDPNVGAPPVPQQGSTASAQGDLYRQMTVGRYSINPETGAIWVQAPKFVLKGIDDYLTKVQAMYNTMITFEGQIVTVTSSKSVSEGIDWTSFNTIANGQFSTVLSNNILGGAVISPAGPTGAVGSVTFGNTTIPGTGAAVGIMSASKQFALFNAFLSRHGQVKILDTPLVTTTSGVPVKFEKRQQRFYSRYTQTAAAGGVGSATVATNTEDIPYNIGMTLRLNPRYDAQTGMVRAQFALNRSILAGTESKINVLTSADGSFQNVPTRIPILSNTSNDGEILLKDGDMIVVGGMTEDTEENTDSGVTGAIDTPARAVLGQSLRDRVSTTYYFAIRVSVKRKS